MVPCYYFLFCGQIQGLKHPKKIIYYETIPSASSFLALLTWNVSGGDEH
jgi:hypothetical protein